MGLDNSKHRGGAAGVLCDLGGNDSGAEEWDCQELIVVIHPAVAVKTTYMYETQHLDSVCGEIRFVQISRLLWSDLCAAVPELLPSGRVNQ